MQKFWPIIARRHSYGIGGERGRRGRGSRIKAYCWQSKEINEEGGEEEEEEEKLVVGGGAKKEAKEKRGEEDEEKEKFEKGESATFASAECTYSRFE